MSAYARLLFDGAFSIAETASVESDADPPVLTPNHGTRVSLVSWYNKCELIRNARLRPDRKESAAIRQIADDATNGRLAEPDQGRIQD
jgi:hypothetical protein